MNMLVVSESFIKAWMTTSKTVLQNRHFQVKQRSRAKFNANQLPDVCSFTSERRQNLHNLKTQKLKTMNR